MGNTSSNNESKGKKVVESKLNSSLKTGILNLSNQDLKPMSSLWSRLSMGEFVVKIRVLTISNNELKLLPIDITSLINLRKLFASKCSIQRIPNLSSLGQLTILELDNNDLENNALVFGILPVSLTKVNLSENHLINIPECVISLTNLLELNLSNNRIVTIDGIGSLISLIDLYLDDNLLTYLSNEITLLINLKHLSIKRNKIAFKTLETNTQSIPKELFINPSFDRLDLEGNTELTKQLIMKWDGIETYLERKRINRIKNSNSGALVDQSLFGID